MIAFLIRSNLKRKFSDISFQGVARIYLHGAAVLVAGMIIAALILAGFRSPAYGIYQKGQLLLFVIAGLWNVRYLRSRSSTARNELNYADILISLSLSAILFIGLLLLYLFVEHGQTWMAAGSSAAFFLPQLLTEQWKQYSQLPKRSYPAWQLPETPLDKRATISLNSITIHIKVTPAYFDQQPLSFSITEPSRTALGKIFHRLVETENAGGKKRIETMDKNGQHYHWQFFAERYRGLDVKYLDPESSLLNNNIRNNTVIIVQRTNTKLLPFKN